jgi:type 1 glutamine amidotransferase
MRRMLPLLGFLLAVTPVALSQGSDKAHPVHVLFLVGGIFHDYDELPKTTAGNLRNKLEDKVALDFVISKDLDMLTPEKIRGFGLLILNVCQQTELSADQKGGLLAAVRNGLPVVALHCTFWSFADFPEFRQLLGAYVLGHPKGGNICLEVTQPDQPITVGLPARFELDDEPYLVDDRDPSMHTFVQTCKIYKVGRPITVLAPDGNHYKTLISDDSGQDRNGFEPEVWTKTFGKGRVFAITFGHGLKTQEDPNYLQLLRNGILWDLRLSQEVKH